MKNFHFVFISSLILFSGLAKEGFASSFCPFFQESFGETQVTQNLGHDGVCRIDLGSFDWPQYRAYRITSEGLFFIFESYSDGLNSTSTGSRSFFLFPRKLPPKIVSVDEERILLETVAGVRLKFSTHPLSLLEIEDTDYTVLPEIMPSNRGGLEIHSSREALILDAGYRLGGVAYAQPKKYSEFIDSNRGRCRVINHSLYSPDGGPILRFEKDKDLMGFLQTKCPSIIFFSSFEP
jgi:hypothetical protein